MAVLILITFAICISIIGILGYKLYKNVYSPKMDILQTLDGKYTPTFNGKFIWIFMGRARFHERPEVFKLKSDAERYLNDWLNIKGLGLKSVGLDKDVEL